MSAMPHIECFHDKRRAGALFHTFSTAAAEREHVLFIFLRQAPSGSVLCYAKCCYVCPPPTLCVLSRCAYHQPLRVPRAAARTPNSELNAYSHICVFSRGAYSRCWPLRAYQLAPLIQPRIQLQRKALLRMPSPNPSFTSVADEA